ncbi:hypothetical protein SH661x_000153 [Planctomicrobium sp. SH661]|uniref:hypothetical protein n=1 Tax=Planctomicrobium sp. SH661 TaxID=3448124 RepID=UPI003F5C1155
MDFHAVKILNRLHMIDQTGLAGQCEIFVVLDENTLAHASYSEWQNPGAAHGFVRSSLHFCFLKSKTPAPLTRRAKTLPENPPVPASQELTLAKRLARGIQKNARFFSGSSSNFRTSSSRW